MRADAERHEFGSCTVLIWRELGYWTGHIDMPAFWDRDTLRKVRSFLVEQAKSRAPWQIALPGGAPRGFARMFEHAGGKKAATRLVNGEVSDVWILYRRLD